MSRDRLLVFGATGILLVLAARPSVGVRSASVGPPKVDRAETGLTFRLREGSESPPPTVRPPAASEALGEGETRAVLERLPPLTADPEDEKEFALRETSLPPPRTGQTVKAPFPPPGPPAPDAEAAGPLRVVRHAPEGDVALAPNLSVTFSQPMVALTSHDELQRTARPVSLTPEPPGQWRWVGTKTLLFEPQVSNRHGSKALSSRFGSVGARAHFRRQSALARRALWCHRLVLYKCLAMTRP